MKISHEEVAHVANLSKLAFTAEETERFATDLTKIVDMVEMLNELDTEGVAVTSSVVTQVNVLRPDQAQAGWNREELFENVPEKDKGFIKVPAIFEEEGSNS